MDINNYTIPVTSNIRDAIKAIDKIGLGFVFLVNDDFTLHSVITDGDFRRSILKGVELTVLATQISNVNFISANNDLKTESRKELILKHKLRVLPILENRKLIAFSTISDFDKSIQFNENVKLDFPVVIMAGGKGTRMKPFTHILPKPLIPIGEKSMLEIIMDKYLTYGINEFYLTVNFKKNLIKAYFEDINIYNLNFVDEPFPLGTAGALKYLENVITSTFFVSNCDVYVKADYSEIANFHVKGNYDLTIVGSLQHIQVPYGVCKIDSGGDLIDITEKPSFDYIVNTGMYILNPIVFKFIPENKFYHITQLITDLKNNGYNVGVFPVSEKSWIDVGQWKDYLDRSDVEF